MRADSRNRLLYAGAVVWVLLTVSLASWWMFFGLDQAKRLGSMGGPEASHLERVQRMFVWEGISFIGLLVVGGAALVVSVRSEHGRQRRVEAFFMAFTHDLKTSLASLQLQAESLREDLIDAADNPNLDRLLKDAVRLQLQLENSLYFAQPDGGLLLEPVSVRALCQRTATDWPELDMRVDGDVMALADSRALESVLRNLLQNAVIHGAATQMAIRVERRSNGRATITTADNGRGAPADITQALGRPFMRPTPLSGTGVGLYVSRQLMRRMNGELTFPADRPAGFTVVLDLPVAV